jgi:argininosuccinate lyase
MLARQGIISKKEAKAICDGLTAIQGEIEKDAFPWKPELEDIHMNIEARLREKIGPAAGKLHTARSRNDQVALDMRMYVKGVCQETIKRIKNLQAALLDKGEAHKKLVMPGYTHLQRAQPVLLAHHLLAYFEMLERDLERFRQCHHAADVMPLGSGALAGVPYPLDRDFVAQELGFSRVSANSMDAVSDRDFLIQYHSAAAICMMHLSRLAEELVLWSSQEFGFITLADQFTTGSSIMPQKRNPDFAELARGKTGRVYGHLTSILTTLKGLPLTYNRDLQEDKEGLFDTIDTLTTTLEVFAGMMGTMTVNTDRVTAATEKGHMLATDLADYLVSRGLPFREAHLVLRKASDYARDQGKEVHQLSLQEYRRFSDRFDRGALNISPKSSVEARDLPGGTSPQRVAKALKEARKRLEVNQDA